MAYDQANPFGQGGDPYQGLRNKATTDAGNAQAQNMDAISRRFAAMGNLNSGAYVQAQTDANRNAQQDAQDNQSKINLAEQESSLPYAQMQQQESQFGRQLGQQEGQYEKSLGEQKSEFGQNLALEKSQQSMDASANAINAGLAQWQQGHSGGLLGGGGLLGTGFGRGSGGITGGLF